MQLQILFESRANDNDFTTQRADDAMLAAEHAIPKNKILFVSRANNDFTTQRADDAMQAAEYAISNTVCVTG